MPQAAEDYAIWYHSRLRCVELALADRAFLVEDRFTIADVAVGYALFLGATLGLDERYKPNTKDYLQRLRARAGFKQARLKQEGA